MRSVKDEGYRSGESRGLAPVQDRVGGQASVPTSAFSQGVRLLRGLGQGLLLAVGLSLTVGCATGKGLKTNPQAASGVVKPVAVFNVTVDAETLFESCHADPQEQSLNLDCDGQVVTYVETKDKSSAVLETQQREAITENLTEMALLDSVVGLSIESTMLTVRMVSVTPREPESKDSAAQGSPSNPKAVAYVYSVAYQTPEPLARGAMCSARAESDLEQERCMKYLGYLMLHGMPELPDEEEQDADPEAEEEDMPPSLLGKTLDVPENCEVGDANNRGGHLLCEDGSLSWFVLPDLPKADELADELADHLRGAKGLKGEERKPACKLQGLVGSCVQLSTEEKGDLKNVVILRADANDDHLVVVCYNLGSASDVHAVCRDVMSLE